MFGYLKRTITALETLAEVANDLRTDPDRDRSVLRALETRVEKLETERGIRETEMADLRTRYETIIKRVGARLKREDDLAGNGQPDAHTGPFRDSNGYRRVR